MPDMMKKIVACGQCGQPEYYGEMRWLDGTCSCRSCYRTQYERVCHRRYEWTDLDGRRPTQEEYEKQERGNENAQM